MGWEMQNYFSGEDPPPRIRLSQIRREADAWVIKDDDGRSYDGLITYIDGIPVGILKFSISSNERKAFDGGLYVSSKKGKGIGSFLINKLAQILQESGEIDYFHVGDPGYDLSPILSTPEAQNLSGRFIDRNSNAIDEVFETSEGQLQGYIVDIRKFKPKYQPLKKRLKFQARQLVRSPVLRGFLTGVAPLFLAFGTSFFNTNPLTWKNINFIPTP